MRKKKLRREREKERKERKREKERKNRERKRERRTGKERGKEQEGIKKESHSRTGKKMKRESTKGKHHLVRVPRIVLEFTSHHLTRHAIHSTFSLMRLWMHCLTMVVYTHTCNNSSLCFCSVVV